MIHWVALLLLASAEQQAFDVMTNVASALSDGNIIAFRDAFDDNEALLVNVDAMMKRADVYASIEFLKNEGDDKARTLELDWFLQIRDKADAGNLVRRREVVTCKLEKRGRKWKIVSLKPQSLFAP